MAVEERKSSFWLHTLSNMLENAMREKISAEKKRKEFVHGLYVS